ncbi:MAG: AmmeMemoRadiSam system protein A [Anaerolineae bacterium]
MNESGFLSAVDGQMLVQVARQSLEHGVRLRRILALDFERLPPAIQQPGASFVTLTNDGRLRGCIGNTSPRFPLAEDVARNAVSAAHDPRFQPVTADELVEVRLEVTVLSPPRLLAYASYPALLNQLAEKREGVILALDGRRGVLLPQVWHRIPDPGQFVEIIARKAGFPPHKLRQSPPVVDVWTFEVQNFEEVGYQEPGG